jgi:hypothetical protein
MSCPRSKNKSVDSPTTAPCGGIEAGRTRAADKNAAPWRRPQRRTPCARGYACALQRCRRCSQRHDARTASPAIPRVVGMRDLQHAPSCHPDPAQYVAMSARNHCKRLKKKYFSIVPLCQSGYPWELFAHQSNVFIRSPKRDHPPRGPMRVNVRDSTRISPPLGAAPCATEAGADSFLLALKDAAARAAGGLPADTPTAGIDT